MTPAGTSGAPRIVPAPGRKPIKRSRAKPGVKRGKVPWIHGTKELFFSRRVDEWRAAQAQGVVPLGRFYKRIANLYILKYGYDMKDHQDLEVDVEDPTDPDAPIPGADSLTKDEASERSTYTETLRKRIGAWYCRTYRGVEENDKHIFADLLKGVGNNGPGYPRKPQPLHLYSRKYYDERVKPRFEKAWGIEVARAEALEQDAEHQIKIRNKVTREVFEEETEEFQAELRLAVETEHAAAVRAWELTRAESPTRTAAEIHGALKNAAFYLEPLADAISEKFQMNCSILLCGPIGNRGGGIDVRSVHAGTTKGLTNEKWHEFDKPGYSATVKSFTVVASTRRNASAAVDDGAMANDAGAGAEREGEGAGDRTAVRVPAPPGGAPLARIERDVGGGEAGGQGDGTGAADGRGIGAGGGASTRGDGGDDGAGAGGGGDDGAGAGSGGEPGATVTGGETHPVWKPDEEVWARTWGPEVKKVFASFATAKADLGVPWAKVVEVWVKVEEASGFNNEGGKITTDCRPKEITDFISKGRHWIMVRKITAPGTRDQEGSYAAQWWAWWAAIKAKGELHTLHGRMGFMLVLLSLLWWGAGGAGGEEWGAAAAEVTTTLGEVLGSGKILTKTPAAPAPKRTAEKRKRAENEGDGNDEEEDNDGEGGNKGPPEKRKRAKRTKKDGGEAGERKTRSQAATERPRARPRRKN
ncbi:hypothetical protein B0H16DRAFT_1730686 [Mycena metata]|uniref:Uncharacterized protein n=1 Tax=Mycena metata TaxID=1033252 RepID=A0AAD7MWZ2_9AGAR|nr:hypothetical protein B0H16DRAFT_1730686 [Mycena metata]